MPVQRRRASGQPVAVAAPTRADDPSRGARPPRGWSRADLRCLLLLVAYASPRARDLMARLCPPARRAQPDAARWDQEYSEGGWEWLRGGREAIHHHVIACLREHLRPNASILDVACGEGILNAALRRTGYARYLGVDISAAAIALASRTADDATRFMVARAETLDTDERFDVVVINEALYFFDDPAAVLARLARLMTPGGVFIISTTLGSFRDGLRTLGIWHDLERRHPVRDSLRLVYPDSSVRVIKVLQPAA